MADAVNSFLNADRRCFGYLLNALGGLEGVTGYSGKWPRKTGDVDALNPQDLSEWSFAINGEGGGNINNMISPSERPKKSWSAAAIFKGRFFDRGTALKVCGSLMAALPAGEDTDDMMTGIQYFGPEDGAMPTVLEEVFTVGETGYEQDGWAVEWPLQVVFGITDEPKLT
jgi:hypothetical protein